jgi:hypothetical protein
MFDFIALVQLYSIFKDTWTVKDRLIFYFIAFDQANIYNR